MSKNYHVVPHGKSQWQVKREGNRVPSAYAKTQAMAIDIGRNLARREKSELFTHGLDGRIRARDSYGKDPFPPRG